MAAGLSAIFRSPIGAAFFAIEVLYGSMEFEAGALLYTMLASVIAYAVNGLFVGWRPLFLFPPLPGKLYPLDYAWYGALGLACGLIATLLPVVFYRLRDAFHTLPLPPALNPAIGGLGVGLLALKFPQILGGGYGWIQEAINGQLALNLLLILLFLKIIAFSLTVSSGGSGGVFAPTLFVGAMVGGLPFLPPTPATGHVCGCWNGGYIRSRRSCANRILGDGHRDDGRISAPPSQQHLLSC